MKQEISDLLARHKAGEASAEDVTHSIKESADDGFRVRDLQDSDLLKVLNGAYIAKHFFGKSTCWFSQKLNHHIKNGKPCDFTKEERKTLKRALSTIAWEIQELADNM